MAEHMEHNWGVVGWCSTLLARGTCSLFQFSDWFNKRNKGKQKSFMLCMQHQNYTVFIVPLVWPCLIWGFWQLQKHIRVFLPMSEPLHNSEDDATAVKKKRLWCCGCSNSAIRIICCPCPVFQLLVIEFPKWVQQIIYRIQQPFLWAGSDKVCGVKWLVRWLQSCRFASLYSMGALVVRIFSSTAGLSNSQTKVAFAEHYGNR
jgi:hypothetical protein